MLFLQVNQLNALSLCNQTPKLSKFLEEREWRTEKYKMQNRKEDDQDETKDGDRRVFRRFVEVVEVGTNPTGRRLQARASDDQACRPFELSITFDYGTFQGRDSGDKMLDPAWTCPDVFDR